MKRDNETLEHITTTLDRLQERFDTFKRLERRGSTIDPRVYKTMEDLYSRNLEKLHTLKAWDEFRAYKAYLTRYLNISDPA